MGVGIIASSVDASAGVDVLMEPFNNFTDNSWTFSAGTPTIVAGRTGTAASCSGATARADYAIADPSESAVATIGFAFRISSLATDRHPVVLMSDDAATPHITLRVTTTGAIVVLRGTTAGTVLGTSGSTGLIVINTWAYIELQVRLGDAGVGTFEVRVNGSTVLGPTIADTKNAGTKTVFDMIRIGPAGSAGVALYDDLYLTMGAGAPFKGDITIP